MTDKTSDTWHHFFYCSRVTAWTGNWEGFPEHREELACEGQMLRAVIRRLKETAETKAALAALCEQLPASTSAEYASKVLDRAASKVQEMSDRFDDDETAIEDAPVVLLDLFEAFALALDAGVDATAAFDKAAEHIDYLGAAAGLAEDLRWSLREDSEPLFKLLTAGIRKEADEIAAYEEGKVPSLEELIREFPPGDFLDRRD